MLRAHRDKGTSPSATSPPSLPSGGHRFVLHMLWSGFLFVSFPLCSSIFLLDSIYEEASQRKTNTRRVLIRRVTASVLCGGRLAWLEPGTVKCWPSWRSAGYHERICVVRTTHEESGNRGKGSGEKTGSGPVRRGSFFSNPYQAPTMGSAVCYVPGGHRSMLRGAGTLVG